MAGRRIGKLFVELFAPKDRLKRDLKDAESEVKASSQRMDQEARKGAAGIGAMGTAAKGTTGKITALGAATGALITKFQSLLGVIMAAIAGLALLVKWYRKVDEWTQKITRTGGKYEASVKSANEVIRQQGIELDKLQGKDTARIEDLQRINAEHEAATAAIRQMNYLTQRQQDMYIAQLEVIRQGKIEAQDAARAREKEAEQKARADAAHEDALSRLSQLEDQMESERMSALDEEAQERARSEERYAELTKIRAELEAAGDFEAARRIGDLAAAEAERHRKRMEQIAKEKQAQLDAEREAMEERVRREEEAARRIAEAYRREMQGVADQLEAAINGALGNNDLTASFRNLQRSVDLLRSRLQTTNP